MTKTNDQRRTLDPNEAIRQNILDRVKAINAELLTRLSVAASDLEDGHHLAALGGLDGMELQIEDFRCLLRLLNFWEAAQHKHTTQSEES
jgi:hypothetical protein